MEKTQKMLIVRLPIDLHAEAKIIAAKKNMTLSTYVRRALLKEIKTDKGLGY